MVVGGAADIVGPVPIRDVRGGQREVRLVRHVIPCQPFHIAREANLVAVRPQPPPPREDEAALVRPTSDVVRRANLVGPDGRVLLLPRAAPLLPALLPVDPPVVEAVRLQWGQNLVFEGGGVARVGAYLEGYIPGACGEAERLGHVGMAVLALGHAVVVVEVGEGDESLVLFQVPFDGVSGVGEEVLVPRVSPPLRLFVPCEQERGRRGRTGGGAEKGSPTLARRNK